MAKPISISIPHQLGRAEARRRIDTGFTNMIRQLPGSGSTCTERWDGDRLTFSVSGLGQTVSGVVDVLDAAVTMEIELPGVLGMIAGRLKGRLQTAGQLLLTRK
jgi:Putative polyhydroxyalkanoic acid system protein (PHA_gran_rgn)